MKMAFGRVIIFRFLLFALKLGQYVALTTGGFVGVGVLLHYHFSKVIIHPLDLSEEVCQWLLKLRPTADMW